MQYYSPYNGCPNNDANFPCIPFTAPPVLPRSQIIGEGDVISVTLPDGTLQLYFIPGTRTASTYIGNYCGAIPAWFIRTIPNIFPGPQQPFTSSYRDHSQANNSFQSGVVNEELPKYQLHFHSDKQTSTTDLHYFCRVTQSIGCPRLAIETQVPARPVEQCRACHCDRTEQELCSDMSIDGSADEKPPCSCQRKGNIIRFSSDSFSRYFQ